MVKILFIIPSLRPGGAERQLVELLKGLDKSVYRIFVITTEIATSGYGSILDEQGVETICFKRKFKYDVSPIIKSVNFIFKNKIDIVHTFLNLGSLIGVLAGIITNRPVVCSSLVTAKDENWIYWLCNKFFSYTTAYFISNSKIAFDNRFGSMRENFVVVYNGIDMNRFIPSKNQLKIIDEELGLNRWQNKIGMIATLSHKKDHPTLLAAAKIILKSHPDTIFVLAGDDVDDNKARLLNLAITLDIDKNILFTGFRPDIDQLIQLLDIIVLLTHKDFGEGLPNAVIEGMIAAKPVIATRGGGTDEIIDDHVNGILIAPDNPKETANAILELLDNKSLAESIGQSANQYAVNNFSLIRYVSEHTRMYSTLVPNKVNPSP